MEKILVSACLLGKNVRYDGEALSSGDDILAKWIADGRVVSVCPEVDAGMTIPRAPAEIAHGDGFDVLSGTAQVVENAGMDVSTYFIKGAEIALQLCRQHKIRVAVLTESSPSCGSSAIYNGRFVGEKIDGVGVTTALLRKNGIKVFSQYEFDGANDALQRHS